MERYTRSELREKYLKHIKRIQEENTRRMNFHATKIVNEILTANNNGKTTLTKHIVKEDKEFMERIVRQLQDTFTDSTIDIVHKDEDNVEISQALITISWKPDDD